MMYSVFKWDTGEYDYFQGQGEAFGQTLHNRPGLGSGRSVQLEAVLPILPDDAVFVGSGSDARGRLAVTKQEAAHASVLAGNVPFQRAEASRYAEGSSLLGESMLQTNPWLTTGLLVGGVYLFYKVMVGVAKKM